MWARETASPLPIDLVDNSDFAYHTERSTPQFRKKAPKMKTLLMTLGMTLSLNALADAPGIDREAVIYVHNLACVANGLTLLMASPSSIRSSLEETAEKIQSGAVILRGEDCDYDLLRRLSTRAARRFGYLPAILMVENEETENGTQVMIARLTIEPEGEALELHGTVR